MEIRQANDTRVVGTLMLETGLALLKSGASSDRIRTNLERLAPSGETITHLEINPLSVSVNLNDQEGNVLYHGTGSITAQGVNFKVLSGISLLSWEVFENKIDPENARASLKKLQALPHYNRWLILLTVSLAGAAFCYTFGGSSPEMFFGFLATFGGLFCKQEMVKREFNPYIITYISALAAGFCIGIFHLLLPGIKLEHAFSTCVLFLIPGVPLINSVTDLIEGYTTNGIARGVGALIHAMAIAFGLATNLFIFGYA